ncbi:type II toxin-antitoxin system VapC family toxin [Nonomuraea cavernae]|uniref:Ribonuclease VapC n=1 Tax=Nonomuraea cavernae TaxID=2045107 RepID=A0A917YZC6_9ACTN|nr:type II toxin-antitoxin system VapC family toxin [Nonomuraea cavernae]MCA2187447.1 type II toxin-antitoxin system VapC family toxin [Nonomuraea cavernae]GGO68652.1 ribonuclease VapC9 [Nonomuraea cavernae]
MIVIDSSAMTEALAGREADDELLDALQASVHAPHLLDVEVLSTLRGLTLGGKLPAHAAEQARADYLALKIARYEIKGIAERIWELRHNYTAYDASYIALAEALECPLYTCDGKLTGSAHDAEVRVFARD